MRILFLINAMGRGGAEVQVRDLALEFARRGDDVRVVVLLDFEDFERELVEGGVSTVALRMTRGHGSPLALARLVRELNRFRPDVVHAHMFASIVAARLARLASPRLLTRTVLVETSHTPFERSRARYRAYAATRGLSDRWTCVCREGVATHESEGAVRPGGALLVRNGVPLARFDVPASERASARAALRRELGVPPAAFVWLMVGSLRDDQKDVPNLLSAVENLPQDEERVVLVVGDGPLRGTLESAAQQRGLRAVRFLGLRHDIAALMHAADAYVLASWFEALPIVLLEALASGLPTVATRVGDVQDVVVDGVGFVVPARDPRALAEAMARVERLTPSAREALGARGREHATQTFSIERVADDWRRLYGDTRSVGGRLRARLRSA